MITIPCRECKGTGYGDLGGGLQSDEPCHVCKGSRTQRVTDVEGLEKPILDSIDAGRTTFNTILARLESKGLVERKDFRKVDKVMQKLRRTNVIRYEGKLWRRT